MRHRSILLAAALALAVAPSAAESVWGTVKRDFNTAVDSARRGGKQAADAIGEGAQQAAKGVGDTVSEAAGYVTGSRSGPMHASPLPPPRPLRGNAADQ